MYYTLLCVVFGGSCTLYAVRMQVLTLHGRVRGLVRHAMAKYFSRREVELLLARVAKVGPSQGGQRGVTGRGERRSWVGRA